MNFDRLKAAYKPLVVLRVDCWQVLKWFYLNANQGTESSCTSLMPCRVKNGFVDERALSPVEGSGGYRDLKLFSHFSSSR